MNLYTDAKWRMARISKLDFWTAMVATSALCAASNVLHYVSFARWMAPVTQRTIDDFLLLLAALPLAPVFWSRFRISSRRASIQLYVERNNRVSIHWTPLPDWITAVFARTRERDEPGLLSIPRRAVLTQLGDWISLAQTHGFREMRLESPLFVTRDETGNVVQRAWLQRLIEPLGRLSEVDRVEYMAPAPLAVYHAMSYRLFWPRAARRVCRTDDGKIIAGCVVIHLVRSFHEERG